MLTKIYLRHTSGCFIIERIMYTRLSKQASEISSAAYLQRFSENKRADLLPYCWRSARLSVIQFNLLFNLFYIYWFLINVRFALPKVVYVFARTAQVKESPF